MLFKCFVCTWFNEVMELILCEGKVVLLSKTLQVKLLLQLPVSRSDHNIVLSIFCVN